jgi:16S rRNA (adenine1518-N6/adenine1519-N6)-dimethyltransferase
MTLSEIRQILSERDILLTKSLGQHFLHDGNQVRRIIAAAELQPDDRVLEVGPGLGPLTELLLAQSGEVLAIEKDRRLVEVLRERLGANPKLRLVQADALDCLRAAPRDWSGWKLVANLPYSITSPLLVELALARSAPSRLVFTVQMEAAQRLLAEAGSGDYGVLTLLVGLRYEPRGWFKITPDCFFPPPDVASACVRLDLRPSELLSEPERAVFTRLVKKAFSERRKMMFKLLKQEWPEAKLAVAFTEIGLPPQVRAEAVPLEHFIELTKLVRTFLNA